MTLINLLILLTIFYLIYRYFKHRFLSNFQKSFTQSQNQGQAEIRDKVVPCPTCGTYNPTQHAHLKDGKYYCNRECATENV